MFLASVEDLYSRRMLGFATSQRHPTAELAEAALNMAAATRGGDVKGVIFHTDKGAQYSAIGMCKAAIPTMKEAGWGRVIAITSIGVKMPYPGLL